MLLRQKLTDKPVTGFWDGGKKSQFDWTVDPFNGVQKDKKGEFVKIGSFEGNHWFCVAKGKTEKLTLSYAKKHLQSSTKLPCTFEYVDKT